MIFRIYLQLFFASIFLTHCSFSYGSSSLHTSPRQVVNEWLNALQKKDATILLQLLEKGSWNRLEDNFKLYLRTLKEISDTPDPYVNKMLSLKGKAFLEAFLNWEETLTVSKKTTYNISEIKTGQTTSTVTIVGEGQAYKIHLVKKTQGWFIRADYLENLLQKDEPLKKKIP